MLKGETEACAIDVYHYQIRGNGSTSIKHKGGKRMAEKRLSELVQGENYSAQELDSFVSTTDAVLLSTNENQLFTEPEREYKVTGEFAGFFEHSSEDGEKYFRNKKAYIVEKV